MKSGLIAFLSNLFGFLQTAESRKDKKDAILNQESFREAKKKVEAAKRKDSNERLVERVNSGDSDALLEIRKKLGE